MKSGRIITKMQWEIKGGFLNPLLWRIKTSPGHWTYYEPL